MFPIAIYQAVDGAWLPLVGNLVLSAALALGILAREGQLRRAH